MLHRARDDVGQASIELLGLLPLLAVVALAAWQAILVGQSWWMAGAAARAASRAQAVGADPAAAARRVLPAGLEHGLKVTDGEDGVRVRVRVPAVLGVRHDGLGAVAGRARMEPQS